MTKPKKFTMRFGHDGSIHAVANDSLDWRKIVPGFAPKRASRVEIVDRDEIAVAVRREWAMAALDPGVGGHLILRVHDEHLDALERSPALTMYYVDFSPLADQLRDDRYRVCLVKTFAKREDAIHAEIEWLDQHYVKGTIDRPLCYAAGGNTNEPGHSRPVPDVPPAG